MTDAVFTASPQISKLKRRGGDAPTPAAIIRLRDIAATGPSAGSGGADFTVPCPPDLLRWKAWRGRLRACAGSRSWNPRAEKRGLLKRRRDPKDRRKYNVVLTDKGRRLVDRLLPKIGNMILESLHRITWEETRIFWKVSNHIAKNLAEMAGDDLVLD
jgi:hypothetical protein